MPRIELIKFFEWLFKILFIDWHFIEDLLI